MKLLGVKVGSSRGAFIYIWKFLAVCLAFLQQTRRDGFHGSRRLGAGWANERFRQEEAKVSRIPQLKRERVGDPVPVRPVDRASWADICEKEKKKAEHG